MPERPYDKNLEQSTNRWMMWGLVLIALAVLAFPAYRLYEPASREDSREALLASLAEQGEHLYDLNCAACHGAKGEGDQALGAPNLSDELWLYGGDKAAIVETIKNSRNGMMPAWKERLDPASIKELAIYVHSLGGGQ